jgi:chemotaxis protein CheD
MTVRATPETGAGLREITVNVADYAVAREQGTIVTSGLGSCVAIVLHDPGHLVAGLAHVLLPDRTLARGPSAAAKCPETAVPLLLDDMAALGARGRIVGKIVGGARMFGALLSSGVNMGERNVQATREALARAGVPIVAEDVGGEYGRSVQVDVATGAVRVRSLQWGDRVL